MIVCPFGDKYDGLFILYDALYFQTFNPYFIILCHFTQEPWMWIGVSNLWNYVFKGAFFSLSDIRAGAVECDLNRPLPPSSFSWKYKLQMFYLSFCWENEKRKKNLKFLLTIEVGMVISFHSIILFVPSIVKIK